jgi:outer membrane protein insertion porin family
MFIPFGRQVLATSIHGRKLTSDNIEPADLYYLGGFAGLRGFRQNFFRGSGLAWGSLEYRFPTDRLSFFYGFFDAGYIYSPVPSPTETITYGYGAGFRVETVLGIVGVSFALGEGDPVSATKIHFGLVNDF